LDPFGGAITGIVGVNRDTIGFGLGAKPVANTFGFCFGYPEDKRPLFRDKNLTQKMLSPERIMEGVVKGVNAGGNCSGIPTVSGFVKFDERYRGKPLVFVGTVGLVPKKINGKVSHEKAAKKGDYIVMLGGRVGADGIHGATFSSVVMDSNSPATAVQIGDPITQKKMSDAIVKEARNLGLYNSITDNGAGGISCSVAEMAKECGGAVVDLEKVPLKYPGMEAWQIWISESQERMTLAVPKNKWVEFSRLMEKRGVEATVIGEFTDSGKCVIKENGKVILDLEMEFLHNGLPKRQLNSEAYEVKVGEPNISIKKSYNNDLLNLLKEKNLASNEWITQQYDHEVQAGSVLKPLSGPGKIGTDAQVFRPLLNSKKGVVVSASLYPSYSDINTYDMTACAIDTALRNTIACGGKLNHLAILDNFCWCSSNDPKRLYELKKSVKSCYDFATKYQTPFISGKDSMFNDFKGRDENGSEVKISIPPTLVISSIGVIPDIEKVVSPEFKFAGDPIYLLGETKSELGGSEYYKLLSKNDITKIGQNVPKVNAEENIRVYKIVEKAIDQRLLASSISVHSGGLAIALAKACVGGNIGAEVNVGGLELGAGGKVGVLFSESQGRILVSVAEKNRNKFEKLIKKIPHTKLGKVNNSKKLVVKSGSKQKILEVKVAALTKNYHGYSKTKIN
jgi:phosphoribosylformylglycinamidine synthase